MIREARGSKEWKRVGRDEGMLTRGGRGSSSFEFGAIIMSKSMLGSRVMLWGLLT